MKTGREREREREREKERPPGVHTSGTEWSMADRRRPEDILSGDNVIVQLLKSHDRMYRGQCCQHVEQQQPSAMSTVLPLDHVLVDELGHDGDGHGGRGGGQDVLDLRVLEVTGARD